MSANDVILYARVSSKEQSKSGYGIQAQIDEMTAYANQHKLNIVGVRTEVISGKWHLDRRPVLKQAFEDAEKIGCRVMAAKLDRFSRDVEFIGHVLKKYSLFTVQTGINCDSLVMHIHASVAMETRKLIIKRALESSALKRERGVPMGANIPAVAAAKDKRIRMSVAANKGEADAFAEYMKPRVKRMRDTGMSVNAIADELNFYKQPTQRGGKWYAKTVCNLMARWAIE